MARDTEHMKIKTRPVILGIGSKDNALNSGSASMNFVSIRKMALFPSVFSWLRFNLKIGIARDRQTSPNAGHQGKQ
jgi:hypothetical protein